MLATMIGRQRKNLGFRWSKKAKITLKTISFWRNISIFIYNENLPMKSYQSFKICKGFDNERGETLIQQSMRKKN